MATIDIGKIKPVFKGTYDNSTAYVLDDIVYYNGSSYVAKTSTTGNLPTDTTKWNILASGSGGIWDSTLGIGSAGEVVKVNSGATALEFGNVSAGVTNYCAFRANSNYSGNCPADTIMVNSFSGTPLNANGTFTVPTAGNYFLSYSTMNRDQGTNNTSRIKINGNSASSSALEIYHAQYDDMGAITTILTLAQNDTIVFHSTGTVYYNYGSSAVIMQLN